MRSDILRRIISTSISIILAIIFVIFIQNFLLRSAIVHTNEMAPTLNKNDYIMINKLKVTFNLLNEEAGT
ncbi:S26 family signal peptidase [Staphylococcus hominis]|uniref:S26 family signal peptidase n=1 Tax=Staphylococcus hominis TaxID=1290 RepID=UPI0039EB08F5